MAVLLQGWVEAVEIHRSVRRTQVFESFGEAGEVQAVWKVRRDDAVRANMFWDAQCAKRR
jgi:hypothetical protein